MSENYLVQRMQLERAKGELRTFVISVFPNLDRNGQHSDWEKANKMVEDFISELEDDFG